MDGDPLAGIYPLWTPLDLGTALKAWWSADDHGTAMMTDDGAGLISSWTDKKGSMAVTAATSARPTWTATGLNGYPALTFDGTANCFVSTSLSTLPTGATAGEIWSLFSDVAAGIIARYGGTTASTMRGIQLVITTFRGQVTDAGVTLSDSTNQTPGIHMLGGYWSGTTEGGRWDGRDFTTPTTTIASLNTSTTRIRIGATNATSAGTFFNGAIRHVLITGALTAAQRQQMEGWFAWDIGKPDRLPTTHPYRYRAP